MALKATGTRYGWSHCIRNRKAERKRNTGVHFALSLFYAVCDSAYGMGPPPPPRYGKTFLGTHPMVCFHGDSKSVKLTMKMAILETFYRLL